MTKDELYAAHKSEVDLRYPGATRNLGWVQKKTGVWSLIDGEGVFCSFINSNGGLAHINYENCSVDDLCHLGHYPISSAQ
jgi:hypothetical protein